MCVSVTKKEHYFKFQRAEVFLSPLLFSTKKKKKKNTLSTYLERINVIRKHNDLIASVLMEVDEILARLELGWVHTVK